MLTMKKSVNIILLFVVFFLAGVSGAIASVSHDHHEEIADSPFQGKSNEGSLHCRLNKHFHVSTVCPHIRAKDSSREARLASDCGGSPNGTLPASSVSSKSIFLFSVNSPLPVFRSTENIVVSSIVSHKFFPELIDPPPRSY